MSYSALPTRTSADSNSSADINQLQANIAAVKGGMSHVPDVDDIYDLGSATKQWKDLYVDGTAYVDAISNEGAYVGYVLDGYGAMLLNTYSDTDGHRYLFKFQKSHQDTIGNAATVDGDDYGDIQWMGNTGSGFVAAASIRAEQDGAAGASYLPGRIYIYTATAAAASTLKMAISSDGHVNITGCDYAGYCLQLFNDGNNANRKGLSIRCGADDAAGTNEAVGFYDGDGTAVGTITFTDATVSYNAFTGSHYAKIINEIEYGMLVRIDKPIAGKGMSVVYECSPTKTKKDKTTFGVYAGEFSEEKSVDETKTKNDDTGKRIDKIVSSVRNENSPVNSLVHALGDGHILVCDQGGDIEIGDYICSSDVEGHGMRQDDDLLHNYTAAKACENVVWKNESEKTKLIACTYHAA